MNLDQLEAIEAIVEKGSFRAAAEHLNRSQPALSASVKNLEEEFDIKIFDRDSYRPTLTEAGAVFMNASRKTLEAARHAARIAKELGRNKAETKLRVAVDPLASIESIELIAKECARPVIPVMLVMEKTILQGSREMLLSGEIDLAVALRPKNLENLEMIPLEAVHLVGAVSRKLLQEKNRANDEFLRTHAQILVYDKNFDEPADSLMPHPIYRDGGPKIFTPDHFTKLRLIQEGLGWGRISQQEFQDDSDLVLIDSKICENIELSLCVMRPKNRPIGPIARVIWKAFEERDLRLKSKISESTSKKVKRGKQ